MTQEAETETVELAIVSCETCDQLFLVSPRRQACPTCGGPAGLVFFEFLGAPDGLHLKDGTLAAIAPASPPPEAVSSAVEPVEATPAPAEATEEEGKPDVMEVLLSAIDAFLGGADYVEEDILSYLVMPMGAEPEEAATVVGRLVAVRDALRSLTSPEPSEGESVEPPERAQAPEGLDAQPPESI